jgi:hypothetical protein
VKGAAAFDAIGPRIIAVIVNGTAQALEVGFTPQRRLRAMSASPRPEWLGAFLPMQEDVGRPMIGPWFPASPPKPPSKSSRNAPHPTTRKRPRETLRPFAPRTQTFGVSGCRRCVRRGANPRKY